MLCDPKYRAQMTARGDDPEKLGPLYGDLINTAMADIPSDMTITMHLCRGNYKSTFMGSGGYEAEQDILFNRIKVHGYFMEYDSERAGGFEPLKLVPKDRCVVLGLVTTKTGRLEAKDELKRRIDEAAKYISLDQLCLSPQCGFASTEEGNVLAEDEQWAKLRMIVEIAEEVWGLRQFSLSSPRKRGPMAVYSRETADWVPALARQTIAWPGRRKQMPLEPRKTPGAENPRRRARLWPEGLHALCARPWAWPRPAQRRRTRLRLRKKSQGAADLRRDAGLCRLLAAPPRTGRHLDRRRAWRTRLHAVRTGRAARHRDRAHPHRRRGGQGRRQGRAGLFRTRRSATRRAAACLPL